MWRKPPRQARNECRCHRTSVTCPGCEIGIRMGAMPARAIFTIAALFCLLGLPQAPRLCRAQNEPRHARSSNAVLQRTNKEAQDNDAVLDDALTQDDRLSLIAAALDSRVRRNSQPDCSHLVHAIYERAGFPYAYAPSSDLYRGVDEFQRVKVPEPGDLIVWRGHAGIVIKPAQHIFFSFLTSGPGVDDYQASYWKHRGRPRFYRYVKTDTCPDCDEASPVSKRLLKVKR